MFMNHSFCKKTLIYLELHNKNNQKLLVTSKGMRIYENSGVNCNDKIIGFCQRLNRLSTSIHQF